MCPSRYGYLTRVRVEWLPHLLQCSSVPSGKSMNMLARDLKDYILLFVNISPPQMVSTAISLGSILGSPINQNSPEQPPHPVSPVGYKEIRRSNGSERAYSQTSPVSQHTRLFCLSLLLSSLKWKWLSQSITNLVACLSEWMRCPLIHYRRLLSVRPKRIDFSSTDCNALKVFLSCGAGINPLPHGSPPILNSKMQAPQITLCPSSHTRSSLKRNKSRAYFSLPYLNVFQTSDHRTPGSHLCLTSSHLGVS
jgi:hypothetical protein